MPNEVAKTISIGDEVRVNYHRPGLTRSFAEGVVSRVDVPTLAGRVFVIDVTYDVILDRDQPVKTGYQNYVLYESKDDFPGRIEILSTVQRDPLSVLEEDFARTAEQAPEQESDTAHEPEPEPQAAVECEREAAPEPDLIFKFPVTAEQRPEPVSEPEPETLQGPSNAENAPRWTNVVAGLFRKQR